MFVKEDVIIILNYIKIEETDCENVNTEQGKLSYNFIPLFRNCFPFLHGFSDMDFWGSE